MSLRLFVLAAVLLSAADLRSESLPYVPKLNFRETRDIVPLLTPARRRAVDPPASGANDLTAGPVPGDVVATVDAPWTPEIKALATQLRDPMAMFAHVRDHILFEPYAGSRRGALLTLQQRAGNAMDTASLLAALVRSAGYPARYVSGRVVATQAQLQAWLGTPAVADAAELLRTMGISNTVRADGTLEFEHTWLAVHLNGAWVQLDPSYKKIVVHAPSIARAPVEPLTQFLSYSAGTGAIDVSRDRVLRAPKIASSTHPNDPDFDIDLFERRWRELYAWAATKITAGTHMREVFGLTEIVADAPPLPLPLAQRASLTAFSYVPDSLRARFTIEIDPIALGTRAISYTASLPELAGKRITVMHVPATPEDEALVAQHGGTLLTAPLSIKVAPVILVDGREVARGDPLVFATVEHRRVTFTQPGLQTVRSENQMHAGDTIGVVLQYGRTSIAELDEARNALEAAHAPAMHDAARTMSEPVNGAALRFAGISYFTQVSAYREIFARASGVRWVGGAAVAMVMQPMKFDPGVPVRGIRGVSLGFDVPLDQLHAWRTTGSDARLRLYHAVEGRIASALEHQVWDSLGFRAISAVRVMNLSLRRGIAIRHNITQANWSAINRQFRVGLGVVLGVTDAVNAGMVVSLPEHELTLGDWTGTGYLVTDPKTNKSAYIISGRWGNGTIVTAYGGVTDEILGILGVTAAGGNMYLMGAAFARAAALAAAAASPFGLGLGLVAMGITMYAMIDEMGDLADFVTGEMSGTKLFAKEMLNLMGAALLSRLPITDLRMSATEVKVFQDLIQGMAQGFARLAESLWQRSSRSHASLSQDELIALAMRSNSPRLWEDLDHIRITRGWEALENLVRNSVYLDDASLREIAHVVARAPEASGLEELLPRVTHGNSYTAAYTLATAVWANHSNRYNRKVEVTFTPVVGFSDAGDPLFGSARTEQLVVPLHIYRDWVFLMHEPVGPRDLRAWNEVMKIKAVVDSGMRTSGMWLWTAGGMDEQLRDWFKSNVKGVSLTTHRGDSLR